MRGCWLLFAGLALGCGDNGEEPRVPSPTSAPPPSSAPVPTTNSPAPPATNLAVVPTNSMPARINITSTRWLLVDTNANRPYTGTVVREDDKGKKIAVGQFVGGLEHGLYEEWYPSGKLKAKFRYERGQLKVRQEWLENGQQVDLRLQGWAGDGSRYVGPARKLELSVGGGERNLENYRRHPVATLQIGLGPPDQVLGRVWIYRDLKIKHATTGQIHTVAKFTILDGRVLSVAVE